MPVQWVAPTIEEERLELRRTARSLRLPVGKVLDAVREASLVELTDHVWARLDNSESYGVTTVDMLIEVARTYNRDVERILAAFRRRKGLVCMAAPILLERHGYRPYLIAGNTRLCACRALRVTPQVLLATVMGP